MKTIITLVFDGKEGEEVAELTKATDLGQLLRDALGEFVTARQPEREYVMNRHGFNGVGEDERSRQHFQLKLSQVVKRNLLACLLKRTDVTIETSPEELEEYLQRQAAEAVRKALAKPAAHQEENAMKEVNPICSKCSKSYDLASWQTLRLCSIGTTGQGNVATSIVQDRICTCGGSVSVSVPMPLNTSKTHADALVAVALLSELEKA